MTVVTALGLLAGLQIKHMLADFWWQTAWMLHDKARWGAPGGVSHAALHGGLTAAILLLFGLGPGVVVLVSLAEMLVHYHIDWAKARWSLARGDGPGQAMFWRAIGVDQLAHQLCYLALVALLAR